MGQTKRFGDVFLLSIEVLNLIIHSKDLRLYSVDLLSEEILIILNFSNVYLAYFIHVIKSTSLNLDIMVLISFVVQNPLLISFLINNDLQLPYFICMLVFQSSQEVSSLSSLGFLMLQLTHQLGIQILLKFLLL